MVTKKITINDVAIAAGVSVSTVSLVLSGKGRISSATSQRVNAAVAQLGFVRNRQASSLRGGQSGIIGLIVRDLTSPFYAELTAGLTETLEAQGQMVFLIHGGRDATKRLQRLDALLKQGVDGVIIAGASESDHELYHRATSFNTPIIFASRASYQDDVDTLCPDNMQAAQMMTEYLIRQGHQRIAWLGGKSASLTRAERVGGYCSTLVKYGQPFHSEWVVECENSQKKAAEAMERLLHHSPTISAVICYNDTIAMGAWFGLLRSGHQSGEGSVETFFDRHVTLGAFTDADESTLDDLPIIRVMIPAREMGHTLAEKMMQRIDNPDNQLGHQIVAARLIPTQ